MTNAGCHNSFRGHFGTLLGRLRRSAGDVLFVSRVRAVVNTNTTSNNRISTTGLVGPLLSDNGVHMVNSAACRRFDGVFRGSHTLTHHFRGVSVARPSVRRAIRVVGNLGPGCRTRRSIHCATGTIHTTMRLTIGCVGSHRLPSGTVSIVSRTNTHTHLVPMDGHGGAIGITSVRSIITHVTHVPRGDISRDSHSALGGLNSHLGVLIFNRSGTVRTLARTVGVTHTNLNRRRGPINSFLFTNPAKIKGARIAMRLSGTLNVRLLHFSVSRCVRHRAIDHLVNTPPKCINFSRNNLLASTIVGRPRTILLLSRVRGTRPSIFGVLLRIVSGNALASGGKHGTSFHGIILIVAAGTKMHRARHGSVNLVRRSGDASTVRRVGGVFAPRFHGHLSGVV